MPPLPVSEGKTPAINLDDRAGLWMDGRICSVVTSTQDTGEKCAVTESALNVGQGPPMYRFKWEDQLYIVLEGKFLFELEGKRRELGPGDVLFAPRGALHTYLVLEGAPARYLIVSTPGTCWEFYMQAISVPAQRNEVPGKDFVPLPMEVVHRVALGAGLELIGPRLADSLKAEALAG